MNDVSFSSTSCYIVNVDQYSSEMDLLDHSLEA